MSTIENALFVSERHSKVLIVANSRYLLCNQRDAYVLEVKSARFSLLI